MPQVTLTESSQIGYNREPFGNDAVLVCDYQNHAI